MVTLARKPVDLDLQISGVDDEALPVRTKRGECPRCTTQLMLSYDEPECLNCGYADYAYTEEFPNRGKENLLTSATCYIFRYVGESENLMETLTKVIDERKEWFCDWSATKSETTTLFKI